jgi:hypothetical protein
MERRFDIGTKREYKRCKLQLMMGLYQVYGHHLVYGSDVLLYIGQTYGVFNWGCFRALRPEVSGPRWTKAATDEANAYQVYEMP